MAKEDGKVIIGVEANTERFDRQIERLSQRREEKDAEINLSVENIEKTKADLQEVETQMDNLVKENEELFKSFERMDALMTKREWDVLSEEELKELAELKMFRVSDAVRDVDKQMESLGNKQYKLTEQLDRQEKKLSTQKEQRQDILDKIAETEARQDEYITKQTQQIKNERELAQLKNQLKTAEMDVDVKQKDYEDMQNTIAEMTTNLENAKQKQQELTASIKEQEALYNDINSRIEANQAISGQEYLNYENVGKELTKMRDELGSVSKEVEAYTNDLQVAERAVERKSVAYEKAKNNAEKLRAKTQEITAETNKINISKMQIDVNKIGNSVANVGKRIAQWALSIIGVASALSFIRSTMSTLSQYDEQVAADIEYIRWAIAMALKPVIEYIIQLIYKILGLVGALFKAIFGVNIWANASAGAFKSAKDNLKGATTQAKELKKQLAGFDEMNILQKDGSVGTGGGGGGVALPSMNLKDLDGELPQWMKDLLAYGDLIKAILAGIAAALIALKLGFEPIQALGIGIAVAGVVYAIEKLLDYLKDPTWENFGGILVGIGTAVLGIGIATLNLPLVIGGALAIIVGLVLKHWDSIKKSVENFIAYLKSKKDYITNKYGKFIGGLYSLFVDSFEKLWKFIDSKVSGLKKLLDDVIAFVKHIANGEWKQAWNDVKKVFEDIWKQIGHILQAMPGGFALTGAKAGADFGNAMKKEVGAKTNGTIGIVETALNSMGHALEKYAKIPGVSGIITSLIKIPRIAFAKGGIVNLPSQGVPIGNAIAGERGAEGIIPLTDSQQMALLGEAIGKYVNINATIPVYVGNRQIVREIKKIENEDNFAFNR